MIKIFKIFFANELSAITELTDLDITNMITNNCYKFSPTHKIKITPEFSNYYKNLVS